MPNTHEQTYFPLAQKKHYALIQERVQAEQLQAQQAQQQQALQQAHQQAQLQAQLQIQQNEQQAGEAVQVQAQTQAQVAELTQQAPQGEAQEQQGQQGVHEDGDDHHVGPPHGNHGEAADEENNDMEDAASNASTVSVIDLPPAAAVPFAAVYGYLNPQPVPMLWPPPMMFMSAEVGQLAENLASLTIPVQHQQPPQPQPAYNLETVVNMPAIPVSGCVCVSVCVC